MEKNDKRKSTNYAELVTINEGALLTLCERILWSTLV